MPTSQPLCYHHRQLLPLLLESVNLANLEHLASHGNLCRIATSAKSVTVLNKGETVIFTTTPPDNPMWSNASRAGRTSRHGLISLGLDACSNFCFSRPVQHHRSNVDTGRLHARPAPAFKSIGTPSGCLAQASGPCHSGDARRRNSGRLLCHSPIGRPLELRRLQPQVRPQVDQPHHLLYPLVRRLGHAAHCNHMCQRGITSARRKLWTSLLGRLPTWLQSSLHRNRPWQQTNRPGRPSSSLLECLLSVMRRKAAGRRLALGL